MDIRECKKTRQELKEKLKEMKQRKKDYHRSFSLALVASFFLSFQGCSTVGRNPFKLEDTRKKQVEYTIDDGKNSYVEKGEVMDYFTDISELTATVTYKSHWYKINSLEGKYCRNIREYHFTTHNSTDEIKMLLENPSYLFYFFHSKDLGTEYSNTKPVKNEEEFIIRNPENLVEISVSQTKASNLIDIGLFLVVMGIFSFLSQGLSEAYVYGDLNRKQEFRKIPTYEEEIHDYTELIKRQKKIIEREKESGRILSIKR